MDDEKLLMLARLEAIEDCVKELKREPLDNFSTHWKCGFNHALGLLEKERKMRDYVQDYFQDAMRPTLIEVIKFLGNQCRIAMHHDDFSVLERRTKEIFERAKKSLPIDKAFLESRLPEKPFGPVDE